MGFFRGELTFDVVFSLNAKFLNLTLVPGVIEYYCSDETLSVSVSVLGGPYLQVGHTPSQLSSQMMCSTKHAHIHWW